MISTEILILAGILLVQPLIALIYLYVGIRLILWWGLNRSGEWVDERVSHFKQEVSP